MKRITLILVFGLIFISQLSGQEYSVNLNGYIGSGPSSCGSNNNGLKWIILDFDDGSQDLFRQDRGQFRNSNYERSLSFPASRILRRIRFRTVSRHNSFSGCESSRVAEETVDVASPCFYQFIFNSPSTHRIYHSDIDGYVTISVRPEIDIEFNDGTPVNRVNEGCVSEAITIDATAGFSNEEEVYSWQFLDESRMVRRSHPNVVELERIIEMEQEYVDQCYEEQRFDPSLDCTSEEEYLNEAIEELELYLSDPNNPTHIMVNEPGWKVITNKTGQSSIDLALSDMYPDPEDQVAFTNRNIQVRLAPTCNDRDPQAITNELTVQYLPDTPTVRAAPTVTPLTCAYSTAGGFSIPFNNPIANNQKISIALKRLAEGQVPLTNGLANVSLDVVNRRYAIEVDNNINITNLDANNTYQWNGDIPAGQYAIQIIGYERSDSGNNTPLCRVNHYFFEIQAPQELVWEVPNTSIINQNCYAVNDGEFQIRVDEGIPPYQYRVDGGGWLNFSGNANTITVSGLAPRASSNPYRVEVIDANGCGQRAPNATSNRTQNIVIEAVQNPISHNVPLGRVVQPDAPGNNTGVIEVSGIFGGTPSSSFGYRYWVYRNGVPVAVYQNLTSRGNIVLNNLREGTYTIQYQDGNNCMSERLPLTVIQEPLQLTFNTRVRPASCSTVSDGEIQIINVAGAPGPYVYTWLENGNPIPGASGNSINRSSGLNYSVEVRNTTLANQRSAYGRRENIAITDLPAVTITNTEVAPVQCYDSEAQVRITAAGGSGSFEYVRWRGALTNESEWTTNPNFSISFRDFPVQFRARNANAISCNSNIVNVFAPTRPQAIYVADTPVVVNNTVFGAATGQIEIEVREGTPPYRITWQRNGVDISNSGQSISGLQAGRYVARITDVNDCSTASGDILVTEPEALTASITNPAITCFEGSTTLTANAQGGRISNSGTYRYQWSFNGSVINGATSATLNNAIQGNYTVRVQDDFTATETSRTVTHPDVLRLTTTLTNISCFGGNNGSIILNPQGGTAPYYYALDGTNFLPVANLNNATIEGLTFGDYSITLRDVNDCEIVTPSSVTLSQPEAMVIELIANQPATTVNGTNGALDITVSLGTLPYRFNWTSATNASFNATTEDLANLSAGQYMVTVTDANNCEREATFEIVEPGPLQVQLAQEGEIFCYGEATAALVATVSGGFPIGATADAFEFRWYRVEEGVSRLLEASNGLVRQDNLLAGIYRVEVEDVEGTQDEARFEIVQPEDLVLRIQNTQAVLCYGANTGAINVTVTGGPINPSTGTYYPYAYRWTNLDDPDFEATSEDLDALPAGTYNLVVVDENLCTIALPDPIVIAQPEAPLELFNIEATNLTGFQTANGGISLELRGGTAPYTYAWTHRDDPSFSATTQNIDQLTSGTYDLVVEDANNCTVNLSQSITEPNQLTIQIQTIADVNNIQCFGETTQEPLVTVTEGGTGIYTYQWYDADNPDVFLFETANAPLLEAGRYVVVVTDTNNNRATARYEVMQPDLLELAGTVSNPLCHGDRTGEIEVSVTGGIPPYNYSWSNGEIIEDLSNLGAGNYSLTVTDANNCSVQQNFSIEAPTALFISDVSRVYPSSSTRNDGRITLTVGGGTLPYTFLWTNANGDIQPTSSNVLDNVGSEKYSVQITDANNCVLILEDVDLFVPPALIVNVSGVNVVTCFGETTGSISAFVSGGVPYNASKQYDYQWFNAVTDAPIGEDAFLLEEIGAGRYYVSVTDAVGASSMSPVFVLEQPGILALELTADFINCGNENDWTVTSNVSGGTPPYRYNWNTGGTNSILENVIAESYSLTVTDSRGCTVVQNITLTVPQALETVVSGTNPTCFAGCDGGITTETLGGTPPYTYVWSNGATTQSTTNLCEGEYTVTITDAKGCYIVETLTLEAPEQLTVNLGEDITLCAGQSARLDATITDANASYLWTATNGFTSTEAIVDVNETGLYEATVINANGCEVTGRVFVEATTDEISANFLTSSQVFVGDSFVIVDNSDPFPDNLQWELPAEALVSYQDQNYAELQFNTPGEYEITVRTQRGLCEASQTKRVVVLEKTFDAEIGPNDTGSSGGIAFEYSIYPNPSSNGAFNAQITLKAVETINIKVFQIGSNVAMINQRYEGSDAYMLSFDISRFTTGVYFVLLETEGQSQVRKLVVN